MKGGSRIGRGDHGLDLLGQDPSPLRGILGRPPHGLITLRFGFYFAIVGAPTSKIFAASGSRAR